MASSTVKMGTCGNVSKIDVVRSDNGKFKVTIDSTCQSVKSYAIMINEITMEDIMGVLENRVMSLSTTKILTPSCLVPSAVMTAAWVEIGMLPLDQVKERTSTVTY